MLKLVDILRVLLFPLIPVYALIIRIRNLMFEKGYLKQNRVNAFVISVGNIAVGGTGKTPMVIFLTRLLKDAGMNPGVLSRGYGRISSGYQFVSDGKEFFKTVEESGDEIVQTVHDTGVPAAVCEDRTEGAKQFINDAGVKTIVLDDAFQHRYIARDVNILILAQRFFYEERTLRKLLLPTGNLREPVSAVERADIVILNRKFLKYREPHESVKNHLQGKKVFSAYYKAIGFYDIKRNESLELGEFRGQKGLVVSGIANTHSFIEALNDIGVDTQNKMIFADHKDYTHKEVQKIRKLFYSTNSTCVITTQKDAVKLQDFKKELDDIDIYYLKIELMLDDEEKFRNEIIHFYNQHKTESTAEPVQ